MNHVLQKELLLRTQRKVFLSGVGGRIFGNFFLDKTGYLSLNSIYTQEWLHAVLQFINIYQTHLNLQSYLEAIYLVFDFHIICNIPTHIAHGQRVHMSISNLNREVLKIPWESKLSRTKLHCSTLAK